MILAVEIHVAQVTVVAIQVDRLAAVHIGWWCIARAVARSPGLVPGSIESGRSRCIAGCLLHIQVLAASRIAVAAAAVDRTAGRKQVLDIAVAAAAHCRIWNLLVQPSVVNFAAVVGSH